MAPLPQENTARLILDYQNGGKNHSILWRYNNDTSTLANAKAALDAFLSELDPDLHVITVLGARQGLAGNPLTFPTVWTGASAYGTGATTGLNVPKELRFIGRSTDGRRVSVSVYGWNGFLPDDFRINAGESATVDAAIASLILSAGTGAWCTISEQEPLVYTYADFNWNSYWERKMRG